jgi:hypothetical protein
MPLLLRLNVVLLHHEATHRILASTSATREKKGHGENQCIVRSRKRLELVAEVRVPSLAWTMY